MDAEKRCSFRLPAGSSRHSLNLTIHTGISCRAILRTRSPEKETYHKAEECHASFCGARVVWWLCTGNSRVASLSAMQESVQLTN